METPPPPASKPVGCYDSPQDGQKKVLERFEAWTQKLSDSSIQLSYALVAANWAVFGSVDKVLNNPSSKYSLILVVVFLVINLSLTRIISELLNRQWCQAEKNPKAWAIAYEKSKGNEDDPWPSTKKIDGLSRLLREVRTWLPLAAGALFLAAL